MLDETIKVYVVDYGRKSLYMRYRDPVTGKQIARSTGTDRAEKRTASLGSGKRNCRRAVTSPHRR